MRIWAVQLTKLLLLIAVIIGLIKNPGYWQGWVFLGYSLLFLPFALVFYKKHKGLAIERLHPGKGVKFWDKVFWLIFVILNVLIFVVSTLDAAFLKLSPQLPFYAYAVSYITLTLSSIWIFWAMIANRWFSTVVRIQKDRHQKVVTKGPYQYVRHPGYLGGLFIMIAIPLALGSLWGLIPGLLQIPLLVVRTHLEDETLKKELKGYKNYSKKTKHRLFPGIW